jgi:hypothetical protein
MYKPITNGLVERTNRTLCSMLAKEAEIGYQNEHSLKILKFIYVQASFP